MNTKTKPNGETVRCDKNGREVYKKYPCVISPNGYCEVWTKWEGRSKVVRCDSGLYQELTEFDGPNVVHYKKTHFYAKSLKYDYECWKKYDENQRIIHSIDNKGYEIWFKYSSNPSYKYFKNSNGEERWFCNERLVTDPFLILLIKAYFHLDRQQCSQQRIAI